MPVLGHAASAGGANIELLIAAFGAGLLGVVFFLQKAVKPQVSVVLLVVAIGLGVTAFTLGGDSSERPPAPDVTLTFEAPVEGATVPAGEKIEVSVDVAGGTLVSDPNTTEEGAGHLHIYVDGTLYSMPSEAASEIELEPGEHLIEAEFVSPDHHSYEPQITTGIDVTAE